MTNTWFTSDIHFSHKNIIKYCNRPFQSVDEMDRILIDNWNAVVGPNDHVYQLGDFCFGKIDHILKISNRLNGIKHYIYGNHDKEMINHEQMLFDSIPKLASVDYYRKINVEGQSIILCHYAFSVWDKSHHGSWNLYGHSHSTHEPYKCGKQMDVGVDNAAKLLGEYRPFSFKEIKRLMDATDICTRDKHGMRD